jgi:hypothetical protein
MNFIKKICGLKGKTPTLQKCKTIREDNKAEKGLSESS